jgi:hypothetical protein
MNAIRFLIAIGVSGSGKTLAESLGWEFYDADDFHPPENVTKIAKTGFRWTIQTAHRGRVRFMI